MGSALSSLTGTSPGESSEEQLVVSNEVEVDLDEEDIRPAKRRKTSNHNSPSLATRYPSESPRRKPLSQVTNGTYIAQALITNTLRAVKPSSFYGNSHSDHSPASKIINIPEEGINSILTSEPIAFQRALRIEVISIEKKALGCDELDYFMNDFEGPLDVRVRCLVQLYDESVENGDDSIQIYRKTNFCTLRTTITDDGYVKRELLKLKPFIVPPEELLVRKPQQPLGKAGECLDLAGKYAIGVTLDPVVAHKNWPPFDIARLPSLGHISGLIDSGEVSKNHLSLYCKVNKILLPEFQNRAADLKVCHRDTRIKIPFGLRVQVKWALPSLLSELSTRTPSFNTPRHEKTTPFSRDTVPPSPLATKGDDISGAGSPSNSRSQRRRLNIPTTYNLKALSAQAQGKSPRKPRSSKSAQNEDGGVNVTYVLGHPGANEYGQRQWTEVGLRCPFCSSDKESMQDLRLHLWMEHSALKFTLGGTGAKPKLFFVRSKSGGGGGLMDLEEKQFQIRKPRALFNLDKFLDGDDSWVKSREVKVIQHVPFPEPHHERHESSSSPNGTRHSSPNTSPDMDRMLDNEPFIQKLPVRPRKTFRVFKSSKPLYHPVTRQVLRPGDELPSSEDENDEGWLHQKHRDILMDFSDLTSDEKDYSIKWNPFIMSIQLTSMKHLPQAVIRFAHENASWFLEKRSRREEFGKKMETCILRGVLTQDHFSRALEMIRRAEKVAARSEKDGDGDVNMDEPEGEDERPVSPARMRGLLDCICCEFTQTSDRVICRGSVSSLILVPLLFPQSTSSVPQLFNSSTPRTPLSCKSHRI